MKGGLPKFCFFFLGADSVRPAENNLEARGYRTCYSSSHLDLIRMLIQILRKLKIKNKPPFFPNVPLYLVHIVNNV